MLPNTLPDGIAAPVPAAATGGCAGAAGRGNDVSQTPEKSTLPSAVRGGGAVRFGLPSAPAGVAGVRCAGHCAWADEASVSTPSAIATGRSNCIGRPIYASKVVEREDAGR